MTTPERLGLRGKTYVGVVVVAGILVVLHSLYLLSISAVRYQWFVLAGLTLLSGSFTVRIPTIPARLSVSETFVFAAVLLFGPPAATLIVVLDSLVISLWQGRRSTASRVLFNAAAPAVAIWTASQAFYWLAGIDPLLSSPRPILSIVPPLLALAALYFLLNSWLIAWAVGFEKRTSAFVVWRQNFLWLSLNYFSGASVAALLLPYLYSEQSALVRILGILLPLLVISYLTLKTALGRVEDANRHLSELNRLYLSTIETLAMAIDAKDQITHGHIRRVQSYAVGLAKTMGVTDASQIKAVEAAALLHDMGKLAVPEYILNKPGPLTPAEFEKMKLHASVGADILSAINFPYPVVPIVRHHHERWDGSGYPDGLSGTDIPMGARILSVVDCFDALTSDRPYRPRLSDKDAIRILLERRGTMYDPLVVDSFIRVHTQRSPAIRLAEDVPHSLAAITDAAQPGVLPILEHSRLEDIAASSEEMLALFHLAREITGRMSVGDVGDVILKHLRRIVPSSLCVLYRYDVDADDLIASNASGENATLILGLRIARGQRLTGWVGANRQTIRNSDPVLDFGEVARVMTPRLRSCVSTPVVANDALVGVLSLYSAKREGFSDDHQRLLEVVARQVSPVLEQSLEHERSVHNTFRDHSTGLPNLEQLHQLLKGQSGALAPHAPVSLVWVALTELTKSSGGTNQTAEPLLTHVASALAAVLRAGDILFRLGDAELGILLLETDRQTADSVGIRIEGALKRLASDSDLGTSVRVATAIVSTPADGDSIDALLATARRLGQSADKPRRGSNSSESVH